MIAHRIERTVAKDTYGRLASYILDVKNVQDPKVFDRLASYVVDRANDGERVVGTQITNCGTDDFELAVKKIEATQASNTRAKGDKSYHLVISFPEGERPTLEQLRDIEEQMCAALGYSDHQRISAIHDDTDNLHIHVAVNKVHPKTRRCVEPYYDKKKLMAACIELEAKHGLIKVNHGVEAERKRTSGEQKMEAHAARDTLRAWVDENAKDHLIQATAEAKSWQDLHRAFAVVGLEMRPYGAGMVIGPPGSKVTLKASDISRDMAIKTMVTRFGKYEPPALEIRAIKPERAYTRAPVQKSPEAQALFARFEAERKAALEAREAARTAVANELARYAEQLKEHHKSRRAAIRGQSYISGADRREMMGGLAVNRRQHWAEFKATSAQRREEALKANPLPTWQQFLQREAAAGDEHALEALRSKSKASRRLSADILTAANVAAAKTVIDKRHSVSARHNGDMVYTVHDGGKLTDRKEEVRMDHLSTGAAFLALSLAVERFGDQPLVLDGTDEFKRALVEVAALPDFKVKFADPALEAARLQAIDDRAIAERNRPAPGSAQEYVAQRNTARENIATIPAHRIWTPADAGKFVYDGKRLFADGSEGVLLRRDDEVFVKPVSAAQVAMASHWPRGKPLHMDKSGRFHMTAPRAPQRPAPEQSRK